MRIAASVISLFFYLTSTAQQYDAQWALGDQQSVLDFRNINNVGTYSIATLQYFLYSNASICDEDGNLLYYTNGVNVCNQQNVLPNGSLCNCLPNDSLDGLGFTQATLFIPKPGSSRYYYLFHFWNDTFQNSRPGNLYYSLIDKEANTGQGEIIEKNINILSKHALRRGGMTGCKHANGRDYWLIMGASGINRFYKFLVTPDSILGPYTQNIGPGFNGAYDLAYSKFSQDGSKYATGIIGESPVLIMDFDRCSGEFSNPVTIFNNLSTIANQPQSGCAGLEFSPNNRFIYVSGNENLRQYDLWATNIQDSSELYLSDSTTTRGIGSLQLAPNGKIYGGTWSGGLYAIHVINRPDLKGDSADFVYAGQPTLTLNSVNLPNLINYKLGPLLGSGCDTITSVTDVRTKSMEPGIIPNPANRYAYVEMGMQGNYAFELINETGQVLATKETRQVDIFDTEQLSAGVYFIRVTDKNTGAEMGAKKLMVVH